MPTWLTLALKKKTVIRSFKVMCIVGTILLSINYGDLIMAGSLEPYHVLKILLTYLVPYCVATYGAVSVQLESVDGRR